MDSYAIIENGYIVNVVVADAEFARENSWVKLPSGAGIGYLFDGENFFPPDIRPTREQLKRERDIAVQNIKVTTTAGNTFDGDEVSQTRMVRAILALQSTGTPTVTWVLADNTAIQATAAELSEALVLAGAAQAALWVI